MGMVRKAWEWLKEPDPERRARKKSHPKGGTFYDCGVELGPRERQCEQCWAEMVAP